MQCDSHARALTRHMRHTAHTVMYISSGSAGKPSRRSSAPAIARRSTSAPALSLYAPTPPGMPDSSSSARACTSAGNSAAASGDSSSCGVTEQMACRHGGSCCANSGKLTLPYACTSRAQKQALPLQPFPDTHTTVSPFDCRHTSSPSTHAADAPQDTRKALKPGEST